MSEDMDREAYRSRLPITQAGLKAREWTLGQVRDKLGQPDYLAPTPAHVAGAPMRLWAVWRVGKAERGDPHEAYHRSAAPVALSDADGRRPGWLC